MVESSPNHSKRLFFDTCLVESIVTPSPLLNPAVLHRHLRRRHHIYPVTFHLWKVLDSRKMAISLIKLVKNFWVNLDELITKEIQPNVHKLIIAILFSSFMVIGLVMWDKNRPQEENFRLAFVGIMPGVLLLMINFDKYIPEIREWRCLSLKGSIIQTVNAIFGGFIAFGLSKVFHDAESTLNYVFAGLFFLMTLSIWDLLRPEIDLGLVTGLSVFFSVKAAILATPHARIPVGIVAVFLLYVRFRRAEAAKGDQNAEQSEAGNGNLDVKKAEAEKENQDREQGIYLATHFFLPEQGIYEAKHLFLLTPNRT